MDTNFSRSLNIIKYTENEPENYLRQVIEEISVLLMVNGEEWLSLQCSPENLEELGIGFLFNQGIIESISEIEEVKSCKQKVLDIWLNHPASKPTFLERTSGCTGGASYRSDQPEIGSDLIYSVFTDHQIYKLLKEFFQAQEGIRKEVRGLHSSAMSDGEGINLIFSDIGRHNTLDKLAGAWLKTSPQLPTKIFFSTGRISSEMIIKCARMRAEIIISLSTPTAQAIDEANAQGITLIGYAKIGSFDVFSHPQRIRKA